MLCHFKNFGSNSYGLLHAELRKSFLYRYDPNYTNSQSSLNFFHQLFQLTILARFVTMQASYEDTSIIHIEQLLGYDERRNNILYAPKMEDCEPNDSVVVFFGGDIQDFRENMRNNAQRERYMKWSLENVATILRRKFPCCHIVVVQPSRYDDEIFSCYDNFVPSEKYGVPSFVAHYNALQHLELLLCNLSGRIKTDLAFNIHHGGSKPNLLNFDEALVKLIGFSKGCVVLNQFIRELNFLSTHSDYKCPLMSRIVDMYFLDGGHAGKRDTWITDRSLLKVFLISGINVYIHVTPYQVKDEKRPWIGEEEKIFYKALRDQNVNVHRKLHFENTKPSLNKHFEVLNSFA